uniref:Secreted protein n=1 Tax=Mesocestoides corti TaxID=53468 RepID=A0A5K3EXJ4_MESCO
MAWFVVFSAPSRYPHPTSTLSTRPSATWNRLLTLGASTVPVSHPDCIGRQQHQASVGHGFVMHGGAATLTTSLSYQVGGCVSAIIFCLQLVNSGN